MIYLVGMILLTEERQELKSEELAHEVEDLINRCSERIMGVGNEQYSEGGHQRFEALPLDELLQYAYEEIEDLIAYASMIHIRLRGLEEALNGQ
jgi:hypothetical protein